MSYTPGPWEISRICNTHITAKSRSIASAGGYSSNVNPEQVFQENQANSCLIAAAPELLEALESIIGELPTNRDWLNPILERAAKDAIAKARGEA
jgi:hypothetical protein